MTQKRKATLLLPEACPKAEATAPTLLPEATIGTPAQMREHIIQFIQEKGITLLRENYIKLACTYVNYNKPSQKSIPQLYLSGKWMHAAGFKEYEYAQTISLPGMLILIPGLQPPPPPTTKQ